jgi:teichuronic acid exporter
MRSQSLKQKTISGMFWSFSDSFVTQSVQFIVGLILARLLSPAEFGLIGMITVFLAVSQSFIDSGFGQALIRKKDANDIDFSTVFYFNFLAGVILFVIFYLAAPAIASFYKEQELKPLARVLGLILLINATSITQRTILTRRVDFKTQTKINFIAVVISGTVAVIMAYKGFGVWSLAWRSILGNAIQSILLWNFNKWVPLFVFSKSSLKELFSFGSRLLLSGLIDTFYRNIYTLVIGKVFSAQELGFYTRADNFNKLPSQNITFTVQRVSFPVLSQVQDNPEKLKSGYRKLIATTMFISFFSMLGMAAIAKSMIIVLIGEKWLQSIPYLQLLCLGGMLYPLQAINLNMLKVKGRSDLFLRLEIIKKLLAIPVIIAGILIGIYAILAGMVILSFVAYFINSYYSGRLINYPVKEQVRDIQPAFLSALFVSAFVFFLTFIISIGHFPLLAIQIATLFFLMIVVSEAFKIRGYIEIKNLLLQKISLLKWRRI